MRYLLVFLALCSAACGTALNYIETTEPPRKLYERRPEQVEVFIISTPNRPFVEVGMIESQQEELSVDDAREVVAKMRRFAGEHGCDALAIFSGNDTTNTTGGKDFTTSHTLKGYRGSCLVYTGSSAEPSATPLAANGCLPNSTHLCYGPGGCRGGQRCTADGRSYTLCDCGSGPTAQQPSAVGQAAAASRNAP
jgi:hypothetical protein